MIDLLLRQLRTRNDELIEEARRNLDVDEVPPYRPSEPFRRRVTLEVVGDSSFVSAAKEYIGLLLRDPDAGILYDLMDRRMRVPLDVRFDGELAIECARHDAVVARLDDLASEWARRDTLAYEITRVELLYFFVLVLNPELNWITVDFMLQGSNRKGHEHLIAAPGRLVRNRRE